MSALTFTSVRKTFGPTVALERLDLAIEPGELISLLGPSGCGKTTALRIAAGFEKADSGTYVILRQNRGRLIRRPQAGGMVVVADGRPDWVGWLELKTQAVTELAVRHTAQAVSYTHLTLPTIYSV